MANIAISSLPTGTATGGDIFVGNQSGTTKALSLGLDAMSDYEQGTFTPTLYGTTTAGTTTYTVQLGDYEKVGRLIYCTFTLIWTNATGTGEAQVGGLPYTPLALSGTKRHAFSASYYNGLTLPSGKILKGYVQDSQAYINLFNIDNTTAGDFTDLQSEMTTSGELYGSMTYLVAS